MLVLAVIGELMMDRAEETSTSHDFALRLSRTVSEMHVNGTIPKIVDSLRTHVPELRECDSMGVLIVGARHTARAVVATGELARVGDEMQVRLHQGPGISAVDENGSSIVVSADCSTETRWPRWSRHTVEIGAGSVASIRLQAPHLRGALNFYANEPRTFTDDVLDAAVLVARHVSIALADARSQRTLQQAVEARHRIGQAQGILMERYGLDADRAYSVLLRYSQDNNIKLRDVAVHVVATRALPDQPRI